ncbi:hybrid sensor histidine kinase/response regulator [Rhodopirellula sp. MGV]|uniref:hybrid sensor histidine kinase/response regulator n=1 Tax=Rhodopirellula sp. MGV TaxID=2023130 RepID=UPI000B9754E1|nr:hybrid sensor histidine kinase/response regulator [Rhodopirellula sp. MGV]OYP31057.1 hypothetical protein CGZ80_22065 [Rhodopirellula sp. MGV]PNY38231.1 hybrid sensor histidine kinase/response regulator [Rhodopirellula baltica]
MKTDSKSSLGSVILMIDDNPADAHLVKRLLASVDGTPYSFLHVDNAPTGLTTLSGQTVDCVVLDYQLGAVSGIEILTQIRASGNDVPVIALTGEGSEFVAVETMKAGAQDYLVKGQVTADRLHRSIVNATKTVELERQLEEQKSELLSFTGMVSHDLRTPLRHLCQFAELLCGEVDQDNEDCKVYIEAIRSAGKRMTTLIDNLLEYAKYGRSSKDLVPVDLNLVLENVVADLTTEIRRANVELNIATLPEVFGDPTALGQLFQNLIGNGIKYNDSAKKAVWLTCTTDSDQTIVSIRDNGIGIAEEYHLEVFRPLRRLHGASEYDGTGLGLATAARIAKQHQARIWLESEIGTGTTFHIAFPRANSQKP